MRAIRAGLALQKELMTINAQLEREGLPRLQVGIGIATGTAAVGTLGKGERRNILLLVPPLILLLDYRRLHTREMFLLMGCLHTNCKERFTLFQRGKCL